MRKILYIAALVLAPAVPVFAQEIPVPGAGFGTQTAWDNPQQNMGDNQSKPGYQRVNWEPGNVIPLRLRDGMLTTINFPEWETIKDAYVGDKDFFDGRPVEKNTFMISPVDGRSMADTNLFIFGNSGNKYVFYLKSEPFTTDKITASIVDVNVPPRYRKGSAGAGIGGAPAAGVAGGMGSLMGTGKPAWSDTGDSDWEGEDFGWIKSVPINPTEFRFDLDVFVPNPDDYVIAPERVWRDQVFTYIDFGEKALNMNQRPVVSLLVEGGESPVGFRTEGPQSRLLVVEAIGDLVLRNGGRIVCIKLRSKPYLLSNPPPPQSLIAVSGDMGASPGFGQPAAGFGPGFVGPSAQYGAPSGYMAQGGSPLPPASSGPGARRASTNAAVLPNHYVPMVRQKESRTSVELFKGKSVSELEELWLEATEKNPWLDEYVPFYSIESAGVDELGAQMYYGGEFYRLRIGPFTRLEEANAVCSKLTQQSLGGKPMPCAVVRAQ